MTIARAIPPLPRTAVVAIIDPEDLQTLEKLQAVLPQGALHRIVLPAELEALAAPARPTPQFTQRQAAILPLLATNLSNKQIGRELAISHFTVRNHVSQILRALDVPSRKAARALLAGIAPPTDRAGSAACQPPATHRYIVVHRAA